MDGADRGKLGMVGVGHVLSNHKWEVLFMFSKHMVAKDSNNWPFKKPFGFIHIFFPIV